MSQHLPSEHFDRNARAALDDVQLRGALRRATGLFAERRQAALDKVPDWGGAARSGPRHQGPDAERLGPVSRRVHRSRRGRGRGRAPGGRRRTRVQGDLQHRSQSRRQDRGQGQEHDHGGDPPQRRPRRCRVGGVRDRPGRVDHPARRRCPFAHHRAGDPQDEGADRRPTSGEGRHALDRRPRQDDRGGARVPPGAVRGAPTSASAASTLPWPRPARS